MLWSWRARQCGLGRRFWSTILLKIFIAFIQSISSKSSTFGLNTGLLWGSWRLPIMRSWEFVFSFFVTSNASCDKKKFFTANLLFFLSQNSILKHVFWVHSSVQFFRTVTNSPISEPVKLILRNWFYLLFQNCTVANVRETQWNSFLSVFFFFLKV